MDITLNHVKVDATNYNGIYLYFDSFKVNHKLEWLIVMNHICTI
jgi:hypothetical protein